MALTREHTSAGYWADHGILVVRDQGGTLDAEGPALLVESATGTQPGGTIAHAGAGWLWGRASSADAEHEVRLEAHDGAPADDRAEWDDVMETPYLSFTGTVGLALMTGDDLDEHTLLLGPPGRYRVRVSCGRPAYAEDASDAGDQDLGEGDTWRLQFWAPPGDRDPPRWLARGGPAAEQQGPGWDDVLDYDVATVLWGAQIAVRKHPEGVSAAQIAAARPRYLGGQSAGTRPGDPVWEPVPPRPLTTGHPDLDADEAQIHAGILADRERHERELAEIAAQLGVPAPATVAEVLPLLVRAGLLTADDASGELRYRPVEEPPRVQDVLTLPAGQLAELDRREAFRRYAALATDLVSVALWTDGGHVGTAADLAERVLTSPDEVRAALRYAQQQQLLRVDGDPGEATSQLTLTALPRPQDEVAPLETLPHIDLDAQPRMEAEPPRAYHRWITPSVTSPAGPPPLPEGAPPRAGIVTTSGILVAWRDGRAEVLGSAPGDADRAVETRYGVVVLSLARCMLVRPGGQAEVLATDADHRSALSTDGRYLALSQTRSGRRLMSSLHVIDLSDGSRQTLRWSESLTIAGSYGGAVYFSSDRAGGMCWTPGSDPEPLPWRPRTVDRLAGTVLVDGADRGVEGWLILGHDRERRNVLVTGNADLAPGGTHLIDFRYHPPAVTLFDIAAGGAPAIWWLPDGCDTSGPCGPAWEDAGHLLFRMRYTQDAPAVRLDVRTGAVERVPFPGTEDARDLAAFIESLG